MLGYFGPAGTFTHQALLSLSDEESRPYATVAAALHAVRDGEVDGSVVPIENSVEGGAVSGNPRYLGESCWGSPGRSCCEATVQRRASRCWSPPGHPSPDIRSSRHAPRTRSPRPADWLADHLPGAGSMAGRLVRDRRRRPEVRANAAPTRLGRGHLRGGGRGSSTGWRPWHRHRRQPRRRHPLRPGGPARSADGPPTGPDKTTMVAFMREDHPGALLEILEQLASRGVDLSRIEARPTTTLLGDYCFSVDAEGHRGPTPGWPRQ